MIPLSGANFPTTPAELADSLRVSLREVVRLPDEQSTVIVDTDRLRIDLSGGTVNFRGRPEDATAVGSPQPGPSFTTLNVLAHPVLIEGAKIYLDLTAADVRFDFAHTRTGRAVMALAGATHGGVTVRVSRADLQKLVEAKARAAAGQHGVEVERIDLNLTQLGPRSVRLAAKAAVQTKALFKSIRGVVTLTGRADVDNRLVAKLSELNIAGEGMMIALAANLVRGRLTALEGKEFPLTSLGPGGILLRDVQLQVGDDLTVTAAFGG